MNTSRRSISRLSKIGAGALGLSVALLSQAAAPPDKQDPAGAARELPPFLESFHAVKQPRIATRTVTFPSAVGQVGGFLARPETDERLPALLLLPGQEGISGWMRQNGREFASIGYVSLVVDSEKGGANREDGVLAEERALAKLSAAVRWLRRRPDVLPEAIGVAGWAQAGPRALALAGSMPVQACVICDGPISKDVALLAGLRGTPVLAIFAGKDGHIEAVPVFRKVLETARVPHKICVYEGVSSGFMEPRRTKAYAE